MMTTTSVLFCVSGIVTGNETSSTFDFFGASLFFLLHHHLQLEALSQYSTDYGIVIGNYWSLIVFSGTAFENMVLHATHYCRARETVTGFPFTTKWVL